MLRHFSLSLVCFIVLAACSDDIAPAPELPLRPVRYARVGGATGADARSFPGVVQPSKESRLSFKVGGPVREITVRPGDAVKRHQVLAKLDTKDLQVQVDQANAQRQNALSVLKIARPNYERIERLYENNNVSLADYEAAKGQFESARAQVDAATKSWEAAKNQLAYSLLKAPFRGVVSHVAVEEGELVQAGQAILSVSSDDALEVATGIPEGFIANLQVGSRSEVRFSALKDKTWQGKVQEVGFTTNESGTYPVVIQLDQVPKALRPGMAADVRFSAPTKSSNTLLLPAEAVGNDPDGHFVFVLSPEGGADENAYIAKKIHVQIGALQPGGFVLKSGVQAGDLVATAGLRVLLDGMRVRLLEQGAMP